MSSRVVRDWFLPLLACVLLFALLLCGIPYARGYGWAKESLFGILTVLWGVSDWAHGMFVPFICLGLCAMHWRRILATPLKGNLWGGALILFGVFVYCIGLKAETEYFGYAAIQILLAGVIIWFWGLRIFALLSFAWIFFLFSWPMPFLDGMVALPLRLVMSHTAHDVLNLLGTANVQSGTAILSAPNPTAGLETGAKFSIDIADPCSGLHSLFALMMISALAAYLSLENIVLRWVLFLAAIPLAIAGNVVRILLLVWGTERFGSAFTLGTEENPSWFHLGCGFAVYLVALGLLFALISFFNSPPVAQWARRYLSPFPATPATLPATAGRPA